MKEHKICEKLLMYMLPLAFFGREFLILISFYIDGNKNDILRTIIFWGGFLTFFLLLINGIFRKYKENSIYRKQIYKIIYALCIYALFYGYALFRYSDNFKYFLKSFVVNEFFVILLSFSLYYIYVTRSLNVFIKNSMKYIIISMPIALFYIFRMFFSDLPIAEKVLLGDLSYMSFAILSLEYSLLIFLKYQFNKRNKIVINKKESIFDFFLFFVYTMCIIISGTKSTICCMIVMFIAIFCYMIITKRAGKLKLVLVYGIIFGIALATPEKTGFSRIANFIYNMPQYLNVKSDTIVESEIIDEQIQEVNEIDTEAGNEFSVNETDTEAGNEFPVNETDIESENEFSENKTDIESENKYSENEQQIENEENSIKNNVDSVLTKQDFPDSSTYRSYLMQSAISEAKSAWASGNGILYFQNKYGIYPHSPILEMACDFGIIIVLLFGVAYLVMFVTLLKKGLKNELVAFCLIYIITDFPNLFLNHSIYSYKMVVQYVVAIYLTVRFLKAKKEERE